MRPGSGGTSGRGIGDEEEFDEYDDVNDDIEEESK